MKIHLKQIYPFFTPSQFVALVVLLVFGACSESFVDSRDGQSYKIVQIGSQIWMAENLNYSINADEKSFCPNGDKRNCKKMGRLYTWELAKIVCPDGWRLPSQEDFITLLTLADGNALKSTSGWFKKGNGLDDFGFKAIPAGYKRLDGRYDGIGGYAYFWSSSEDSDGAVYFLQLDFSNPIAKIEPYGKGESRSVRCVK